MEASHLTDHISRRFNKDLEELRNNVQIMGGLVEAQLSRAIAAIVSGDSELGLKVANDDYKVNKIEVAIDEECSRILATRSPAAGDLRLIVAIIKTITDLERIGDEAEKIGFLASKLAGLIIQPLRETSSLVLKVILLILVTPSTISVTSSPNSWLSSSSVERVSSRVSCSSPVTTVGTSIRRRVRMKATSIGWLMYGSPDKRVCPWWTFAE